MFFWKFTFSKFSIIPENDTIFVCVIYVLRIKLLIYYFHIFRTKINRSISLLFAHATHMFVFIQIQFKQSIPASKQMESSTNPFLIKMESSIFCARKSSSVNKANKTNSFSRNSTTFYKFPAISVKTFVRSNNYLKFINAKLSQLKLSIKL